jgi:hypothetical protein
LRWRSVIMAYSGLRCIADMLVRQRDAVKGALGVGAWFVRIPQRRITDILLFMNRAGEPPGRDLRRAAHEPGNSTEDPA